MTVSETDRGQRSDGSGQNEIDYNRKNAMYDCTIEPERILNALP